MWRRVRYQLISPYQKWRVLKKDGFQVFAVESVDLFPQKGAGAKNAPPPAAGFFLKLALKNYFSELPSTNKIHQKSGSEKHLRAPAALFYFIC